ncbi:hypothetical protein ANOM_000189 [Aspergillus nomiae NRRL 13137]|uniref:Serine hydrolase domain-containing protein n=1 Tax=Aspergillus nomiae NRRL (strain ATCC 15546 / NRRL 13137 / CBS 260.88 / M93) TaxID=1509407 RepID=A0A0L1JIK1_ASPN3|nr:uncharacterized protein ANOM_000189 [Aspergillus nomiae NRRL 13137]KNG91589.1 hypothetical protein ANOM_000189 [Aspergillus nomiae NRRL 13137]
MRILYIHKNTMDSSIFQAKTIQLQSLLPPEYIFVWMDREFHVPAQKELTDVYPCPYLSHLEDLTTRGTAAAVAKIEDFIQSHGPFDGLMGICEGASLCATVILKYQQESPASLSPFKFAIFINSWLPFSWTPKLGHDVTYLLLGENPLDTNGENWQKGRPAM